MSTYEISKSSLLSLKAEILRKQEELTKAKADNEVKIRNLKKNSPLDLKNKGVENRQIQDSAEEEDLLKKSREALEAKSRLYDKLSKNTKVSPEEAEFNRRYLVRFDKKSRVPDLPPEDSEDDYDREEEEERIYDNYEPPKNPDEEWVEYVDCLGRTRTCLRKDLEYLKRKDKDLQHIVDSKKRNRDRDRSRSRTRSPEPPPEPKSKTPEPELTEENELLSNDMRREMLRRQWEKEEEELRDKNDIHYQDILFNEARTHGVGYYGFSKDEQERAKQQEALKKLREETKQQQKKSQDLKAMREKQLAARVRAAKNRKRERMGLPPEEEEPEKTPEPEKPKEEEKPDEKENELEEKRKNHIRPWDIGKEGVKKTHYEHTQEEWVDKKRRERPSEFAPPSAYHRERRRDREDRREYKEKKKEREFRAAPIVNELTEEEDSILRDYRKMESAPPKQREFRAAPIVNELTEEEDSLLRDYRKMEQTTLKQRESRAAPILNELSDEEDHRTKGVEIAPPPTYDYYGPSSSKRPKPSKIGGDLSESVEAGLKFLREQMERKQSRGRDDIFEL